MDYLLYEDQMTHMRAGLGNGYFERLLRELVCDSPHSCEVELVPADEGAGAAEKDELLARQRAMTPGDLAAVAREVEALRREQEAPDSPEALATLPRLTTADNVMLQVGKGRVISIQHFDNNTKRGYGFSMDKLQDKKLISHLTAQEIQYDTISEAKCHWTLINWKVRELRGLREHITTGAQKDTLIQMEPTDLVFSKGQQETFTSPELKEYISKQITRGSSNVVQYEVEYHKRIAASFASFILTIIGASLSARKRKGGMGMYLGIGLALSFIYIMLQTVSSTFAVNANFPPMLAAWVPNLIFTVVAYFCYRFAPN